MPPTLDPEPPEGAIRTAAGEWISIFDSKAVLAFLEHASGLSPADIDNEVDALRAACLDRGNPAAAQRYAAYLVAHEDVPKRKAVRLLQLGGIAERLGDFSGAAEAYTQGVALPAPDPQVAYFLRNNLGFSLNQLGDGISGEQYCRRAIAIEPRRHNARKNLGVALALQCRYDEAAECFAAATRICPTDMRAMKALAEIVSTHASEMTNPARGRALVAECKALTRQRRN